MIWLLLIPAVPALCIALLLIWVRIGEAPQIYQNTLPAPISLPGLWFCAHRADRKYGFQHLYICMTPKNPAWAQRYPEIFCKKDDAGRIYGTLGAGPKERKLFLQFNRVQDLTDPISYKEEVPPTDIAEEDRRIEMLIESHKHYNQQPAFNAWPPFTGNGYNCNCMMSALAKRAGMELPKFSQKFMLCPGTERPVPEENFDVRI